MVEDMPTATISMLRRKTHELLKRAENHPILITRYGKPALVLMSAAHYEALSSAAGGAP
ncbi:type II toxin-antitoxin system prevent-host-death family antitoxin [Cognatiyoonia sp. IB215446]|uniref:type II toxin-antitoxin system prevent-host-death family antitoxin n=1 Tax=Cognatiyoonia sp. IB215446 TaxID=3097355 RepID=UPI002A0D93A2|nr:type II toxin-antitoxin system prevent-host-death family antitoxin [Cognatiyoonia sp. IB215446]MDX8350445.1 type II toxin-antitoxin system prevent-host-death family antitoxin [Cognatiyoonia sp. IB215446]